MVVGQINARKCENNRDLVSFMMTDYISLGLASVSVIIAFIAVLYTRNEYNLQEMKLKDKRNAQHYYILTED